MIKHIFSPQASVISLPEQNVAERRKIIPFSNGFNYPDKDGVFRTIMAEDILLLQADRKTTTLYLHDATDITMNLGIGQIARALEFHPFLVRIHRSYIINITHIRWYDPVISKVGICFKTKRKGLAIGATYKEHFERYFFRTWSSFCDK